MAAFIVISADNRLHYLVDGIEKCRPLNPSVVTDVSTGKILKSENGCYTYEYKIHGEGSNKNAVRSLSELLSNQLAAFRLAHSIPKDQLVNIFFLENPLTESDYDETKLWIEEFDKVYDNGKGSDTAFCLYRIIFSYCHETPTDVCSQIDCQVLKSIIEQHRNNKTDCDKFQSYIFYIDNQKSDAAATCLSKEDHDLKMPRFLLDFMMLISNPQDSYNVLAAINGTTNDVKCFSVGYGESMYYFPDVVEYYKHADKRDLYNKYLNDEDETGEDRSKKAMDVDKRPFGLKKRLIRLKKIYGDVPFNERIESYDDTADRIIDSNIVLLKEYIVKEREQEIEDFLSSEDIKSRNERISKLEHDISALIQAEDESIESFESRRSELKEKKKSEEKELQRIISEFHPQCPTYIDRKTIYLKLCGITDEEEIEKASVACRDHYNKLVDFVLTTKFLQFVQKLEDEKENATTPLEENNSSISTNNGLENNPGCLGRIMFWEKNTPSVSLPHIVNTSTDNNVKQANPNVLDLITEISEQRKLKKLYRSFKSEVGRIQSVFETEKSFCENFKLKSHTNHYFPLICLKKLKEQQIQDYKSRISDIIASWRGEDVPTRASLDTINDQKSSKHTQKYRFIDWAAPFSFIESLPISRLSEICNHLQMKAAPFVNYNLTQDLKDNRIIRALFSDRPTFKDEFSEMKSQIENGNEISVSVSSHIASKICFMEFLPMDDMVIDNLVDLQENNDSERFGRILSEAEHISQEMQKNGQEKDDKNPPVEFWGERGPNE